jgi:hypothetical protein
MPLRLSIFALAASLLLVPALPCAAPAAGSRAVTFLFSGGVAEPGGRPVRGAKLLLRGRLEPAALTDAEGRYSFSYAVPDVAVLATAPLRLVLRASHRGWNLALSSGESALAVELRQVRMADGSARLEVRSNDAGTARTVAASLRLPGEATVALSGDFMRRMGAEDRSEPVLGVLESVSMAAGPELATGVATATPALVRADSAAASAARPDTTGAAPGGEAPPPARPRPERPESLRLFPSAPEPGTTPPSDAGSPPGSRSPDAAPVRMAPQPRADAEPSRRRTTSELGPRRAVTAADTTTRAGIRVWVRSDTAAPAPASAGSGSGSVLRVALGRAVPDTQAPRPVSMTCECRVKGTVEVRSEKPLSGALRVVVSLADLPALRDTVALFMGPPRPFDLGRVPCGSHRLEVRPLSARRFTVAPPALDAFDCAAGGSGQFRVVLVPR